MAIFEMKTYQRRKTSGASNRDVLPVIQQKTEMYFLLSSRRQRCTSCYPVDDRKHSWEIPNSAIPSPSEESIPSMQYSFW